MRRRSALGSLALAFGVALATVGGSPAPAAAEEPSSEFARSADGAEIVSERVLDDRTRDITIDSPALATTTTVRLLLPKSWDARSDRDWPVLYLLHGGNEELGYRSWTEQTDVEELTADSDVLVVMPEGGKLGYYSDWYNAGRGGPPKWETYHLTELRQLLEANYGAGDRRAVAGLSMGGYGAMAYAGRHPGMFAAAASYSGPLSTLKYSWLLQATAVVLGVDPVGVWGDPVLNRDIWKAHDPYHLADDLAATPVYISSGDGRPGPFDDGQGDVVIEPYVGDQSRRTAAELERAGAEVRTHFYAGTHRWEYWQRELHASYPFLIEKLAS